MDTFNFEAWNFKKERNSFFLFPASRNFVGWKFGSQIY